MQPGMIVCMCSPNSILGSWGKKKAGLNPAWAIWQDPASRSGLRMQLSVWVLGSIPSTNTPFPQHPRANLRFIDHTKYAPGISQEPRKCHCRIIVRGRWWDPCEFLDHLYSALICGRISAGAWAEKPVTPPASLFDLSFLIGKSAHLVQCLTDNTCTIFQAFLSVASKL